MKKIYLLIVCSFFISLKSFSQEATPNSSFESWTLMPGNPNSYYVPDNWDNLNISTNFIGILTCVQTTESHSGTYACKLITKYVDLGIFKDTANGIITTGHLITTPPYGINGGIPYAQRPDSIYGWIKYIPTAGDSCQIQFQLFGLNHDTIGTALYQTGETFNSYTRFSVPIIYNSSETPDSSLWLISSSNGYNALPNSTMYVDDFGLVNEVGIDEINLQNLIAISPNPANDLLEIRNEKQLQGNLEFFNAEGKKIKEITISKQSHSIDVSKLAEGLYIVQFAEEGKSNFASSKILIQH